jgi:hypothetical protein
MTSVFIQTGNNKHEKVEGENGALQFKSSSSDGIDLFFKLVRGYNRVELNQQLEHCLTSDSPNDIADLFLLAFQTRNCRGGKGERVLFHEMIKTLYGHYPQTVINLMNLVSCYGYYKDYVVILQEINESQLYQNLKDEIIKIIVFQIEKDYVELELSEKENRVPKLSMVSKYAPRANKQYRNIAKLIYRKMYPKDIKAEEKYRKILAKLNKALSTTEVYMCAKNYSGIEFNKVPSVCLLKWRKAFLNETKGECPDALKETGNRFPDDVDRVTSRKNLEGAVKDKCVNGKQLMPHEIVKEFIKNSITGIEEELLTLQWEKLKENVLQNKDSEVGLNLGNVVPLIDVSGSMEGLPVEVAISLGILVSEINNPAFSDTFITFSEEPRWVSLKGLTLQKKIDKAIKSPWGGSTNLMKAIEMILDIVIIKELTEKEIPDLIVFSDMQFDEADQNMANETSYQTIQRLFSVAGMKISGKPYRTPRIIFWNLRATTGLPVTSSTENVQLISGFSPSLLKSVMNGDDVTPEALYRSVLDDKLYDQVREILNDSQENKLVNYKKTI